MTHSVKGVVCDLLRARATIKNLPAPPCILLHLVLVEVAHQLNAVMSAPHIHTYCTTNHGREFAQLHGASAPLQRPYSHLAASHWQPHTKGHSSTRSARCRAPMRLSFRLNVTPLVAFNFSPPITITARRCPHHVATTVAGACHAE